ncbi:glycosyltransferase family 1 protein [Aquimarina mytili]|uniref:Glycosyltransferase family 1 protein n=1 Tax=Aquimarina mytili TaxID=874423 RepID=A0A937A2G2_9FLAO|nr:glycosyltransferase family 1 protein [Aquimarina mytili]MBL0683179.1 glycosyltransferase family 1 protein [Aquimarina mytili]
MIRILQVFTIMGRGGAESMIMNYYRNLDREKVQFDFLVHRQEKGAFDEEIESLGGVIYRLSTINPFFPANYYKELRAFFKEHNEYTVVHSHLNTFTSFVLKIAEEYKIPYRIAHAHTATEQIKLKDLLHPKSAKEALKKSVKFRLKKRIHNHTTHYFSCGEKAGNWLFGAEQPFKIMNNAIDAEKFAYNTEISEKYKKENSLEDQLVIGHIGNFTDPKNHTYLLKVFQKTLQKKEDCSLVLIGDGPLRKTIENEAKQLAIDHKVHFLGLRSDIPGLCQMLDIFVFPSLYEGLPVTLIEAQAAGLKIFASDTITNEVHITDDISFLSIEDAPSVWADKILEAHKYKRANNFDKIKEHGYDIKSGVKAFEDFYISLTSN